VCISPLPLTWMTPRSSNMNGSLKCSRVESVSWIRPATPCDSIRLAVVDDVSPQVVENLRFPMTPATTEPGADADAHLQLVAAFLVEAVHCLHHVQRHVRRTDRVIRHGNGSPAAAM